MIINKITRAIAACLLAAFILPALYGCELGLQHGIFSASPGREAGLYIDGKIVDITVPESGCYFYNQLTFAQKMMYIASLTALEDGFNTYELVGVNCDEYADGCKRSTEALLRDHPEFFWIDGGNQVKSIKVGDQQKGTVQITLNEHSYWRGKDIYAARKEFEDIASEIVATANTLADPYEKVKYVNDWLAENVEYDNSSFISPSEMNEAVIAFANSVYGTLVERKTLCGGYAYTFSYIMNRLGVETLYVTGTTSDGLHAWNAVKLGDEYYYIDVTWADDNNNGRTLYTYFCLDSKEISLTHTADSLFIYPEANGTEYNYYRYEGLFLDTYSFNKFNALFSQYPFDSEFSVKFSDDVVLKAAVSDLIDNSKFFKLQQIENSSSFSYNVDEVHCILTLYP